MKKFFYAGKNRILLIIIIAVSAFVRIYHLNGRDFWYDEAFTGIAIRESWKRMLEIVISDTHPPLYFFLVKAFSFLFNYNVWGIRFFSAVWGIAIVLGVYFLMKELVNKKAAVLAAFLVTVNPFLIAYSQEARMYSMSAGLITFSFYFLIKALKKDKLIYHFSWGIFLGLATLTHYLSFIFYLVFLIVILTWNFFYSKKKLGVEDTGDIKSISLTKIFFGYLFALLLFVPWIKFFFEQFSSRNVKIGWIEPATFVDIFSNIQIFLFGTPPGAFGMPRPNTVFGLDESTVLTMVIIIISLITYKIFKKDKIKALILTEVSFGFLFGTYLLSLFGEHYFVSRYLIAGTVFLCCLLAFWLSKIKFKYGAFFIVIYLLIILSIKNNYPKGYNQFAKNIYNYSNNNYYVLNSYDYVVAKYYFGYDKTILYNVSWPQYNPKDWLGVNGNLNRVENIQEIKNDKEGIVIYNIEMDQENKAFENIKYNFQEIGRYDNIIIYRYFSQ